jgi:hypothetical protein
MSPRPSGRLDRSARIRALNDRHRRAEPPMQGSLLVTAGVNALPLPDLLAVLRRVNDFEAFTPDNDPHGEHDFGAFDHNGVRYFWKIDYYDLERQGHSPDPADVEVTYRVLTVMRADEY